MVTAVFLPSAGYWGIFGVAGAFWVMASCLVYYRNRLGARKGSRPSRSETGMIIAHFGVGLFLIGASLTNPTSEEKHLRMEAGDSFELSGYNFVFEGTRMVRGPNYVADEGEIIVYKNDERVASMYPQKGVTTMAR